MTRASEVLKKIDEATSDQNELTLLRHQLDQLEGSIVRLIDDNVELLTVGLSALRNKTPRVEVMIERAEVVIDNLNKMKQSLK